MEKKPIYGMLNLREESELGKTSYKNISIDIQDIKKSFVRLGFHLAECRDNQYYKEFGFDNFYEFVEKNFHMEKSAVSRHINIFMKFSQPGNDGVPYMIFLDDKYKAYSYSQLSEMLLLNDRQIKQIKPEMTIKEIRNLKKSWREKEKVATVATVATKEYKCSYDNNYICNIEEIMRKHFMKRGDIVGCAGCCHGCLDRGKCEYCCEFAKKEIELCKQKKGEIVEEVEYIEVAEDEKPEFPILKNMEEREKFVLSFKDWNVWCQNELTEETYYRYDLPDGAAIVIRSYPVYLEWKKEELEGKDLFLLKPGYKHFRNCESNMTQIKTYLKDFQKK